MSYKCSRIHHPPAIAMTRAQQFQTAVVYDSYDITHPPRHPGSGWTRFVCISDTHSHIFAVPPGDVLLHSGDLSMNGALDKLQVTLDWLKTLPHPAKFIMAGNHDRSLDTNYADGGTLPRPDYIKPKHIIAARQLVRSKALRKAGIVYLEHEVTTYTAQSGKTYTIYGSPAAPFYSIGAFQYEADSEAAKAIYDRIPASTDILMTHTPPKNICDLSRKNIHAGCSVLAERLEHPDLQTCRLHIFGHIHEARGVAVREPTPENPSRRISVNAALPNMPLPIIVDLKD
ncbi:Metallo-dependent phosphatase [Daedaleopsis nitida]|nr:Metallo-dependent phosphatase [Daedaleopsis nitida]